jgi:hypothetical protein
MGRWDDAVGVASSKDRINLKSTHYAHGRHLESVGDVSGAIRAYEKSGELLFIRISFHFIFVTWAIGLTDVTCVLCNRVRRDRRAQDAPREGHGRPPRALRHKRVISRADQVVGPVLREFWGVREGFARVSGTFIFYLRMGNWTDGMFCYRLPVTF